MSGSGPEAMFAPGLFIFLVVFHLAFVSREIGMATFRFVTTTAFVFTVIARTTSTASAQDAATPTPPPAAAQGVTASWQDGLVLQSTDGDYRLAFGMTAQTDGRFALNDPPPITNTFTIRKAGQRFRTGREVLTSSCPISGAGS